MKFVAASWLLWDGCRKIPRNRLWKRLEDTCPDFGGPEVRATRLKSAHASAHDVRWRAAQSDIELSAEQVTKVEEVSQRVGLVAANAAPQQEGAGPQTWLTAEARIAPRCPLSCVRIGGPLKG